MAPIVTTQQVQQVATQVKQTVTSGMNRFFTWLESIKISGLFRFIIILIILGLGVFGYVQTTRINHFNSVLNATTLGTNADKARYTDTIGRLAVEAQSSDELIGQYRATIGAQQQSIDRLKATGDAIAAKYSKLQADYSGLEQSYLAIQNANSTIGDANSAIQRNTEQTRLLIQGAADDARKLKEGLR